MTSRKTSRSTSLILAAGLAFLAVSGMMALWAQFGCEVMTCPDGAVGETAIWQIITAAVLSAFGLVAIFAPIKPEYFWARGQRIHGASRDHLEFALENLAQGVCLFDAEQRLILSNKRYAEMYDLPAHLIKPGVTLLEILNHRISNGIFAESSPEAYIAERMAWVNSGTPSSKIQRLSDGRAIAIVHRPLPQGGWLTTHEDITGRMQTQAELEAKYKELQERDCELREKNQRFDAALSNMNQGLCVFDAEKRLVVSNRRYAEIYGLSEETVEPGTSLREILEARIHNEVYAGCTPEEYIEERLAAVAEIVPSEKVQHLTDGRSILIVHCPLPDGGWLATHEDISETKKTTDMLRTVIDSFPGGISVFDKNLVLTLANSAFYRVLDLPDHQFPAGCTYENIIRYNAERGDYGPGDVEEMVSTRVALASKFEEHAFERRRPDGTYLEIRGFPLPQGGFVTTYVDVTERKAAELALRDNEELFSKVFQASPTACSLSDPDTGAHYDVNAAWINLLGYSREEALESSALELGVWADSQTRERFIEILKTQGAVRSFEAKFRTKGGQLLDFVVSGELVEVGGQSRLLVVSHDVTERKRVEGALRQSEELFSKAFQRNPIPLSISRPDGTIHNVNNAFLATLGYTREDVVGNSSLKLGIWENQEDRAKFVELLETHGSVSEYETRYRKKTGELVDICVSGEYVDVGGLPHMFNISQDVTTEKRAKRELLAHRDHLQELVNEATKKLKSKAERLEVALAKEKELNELQRQFVSMASHEFRTPLAVIDGMVQRLIRQKDSVSPHDLEDRALKIRGAVQTMTKLMESTLSAARMDAGKITINTTPDCDVAGIIREVCNRQNQVGRGTRIRCDLDALPAAMTADSTALNQVFTNLVSNASKYSPEAAEIVVTGNCENASIEISVTDYGIGIDEEDLPKMFTRFFRAKTSTGIPGTGIGLNIVKTLVELHGGSISVRSAKGKGSTFTVRLPIDGPKQSDTGQTAAA